MKYGLISLLPLQLARLLWLVRSIEPAELANTTSRRWVLLIKGRGFTRILRDEPLASPHLLRPSNWNAPRPMCFDSRSLAEAYGQHVGLLPRRKHWPVSSKPAKPSSNARPAKCARRSAWKYATCAISAVSRGPSPTP